MDDSLYITDDERENARGSDEVREEPSEGPRKERKPWVEWMDSVFGRLEGESTDDDSDALVCEGLDEPNYISADHGYYPDISRWRSDKPKEYAPHIVRYLAGERPHKQEDYVVDNEFEFDDSDIGDDSTVKADDPVPNPGKRDDKWDIDDDDFVVYKAIKSEDGGLSSDYLGEWSESEESIDSSKP
jgi:hypothetical protein